ADLIALRQVGIEIVLPVEHRFQIDLGLEAEPSAHRLLDAFRVDHRQHAGHRGVDQRHVRIGLAAKRRRRPGKELRLRGHLRMDLEADDDLEVACSAADEFLWINRADDDVHRSEPTLVLLVYVGATAYIGTGKQAQPCAAAMTVHPPVRMTKEAFLGCVAQREERYEYSGGRVIMMVRVTRNHSRVTSNLIAALKARLPSERYDVLAESFAVHVEDSVFFPDVLVEPRQPDGKS